MLKSILGACVGLFFITVICSSFISSPVSVPLTYKVVCVLKLLVPALHLSMFIFLGSLFPSVQNNNPSIVFIPVMILPVENFKTVLVRSTITKLAEPSFSYSTITLLTLSVIKEYKTSFFSSAIEPTHSQGLLLSGNDKLPISVFPNIFCTVPTSDPSEVETCIFVASLYCPFGTILSSRSLFILP